MDSLTEKIVQLLVSHCAFRALEVCASEGDWRENTKIPKNHFSFIPHSQLLCFHLVLLCDRDFQSETLTKAVWCTLNRSMQVHCLHSMALTSLH